VGGWKCLEDYDIIFDYHIKKANVVIDALSRKTWAMLQVEIVADLSSLWLKILPSGDSDGLLRAMVLGSDLLQEIKEKRMKDSDLARI
ncbi:unnamed protein product, partial [Dovyalis caffra]